jgi:hypothetical protein
MRLVVVNLESRKQILMRMIMLIGGIVLSIQSETMAFQSISIIGNPQLDTTTAGTRTSTKTNPFSLVIRNQQRILNVGRLSAIPSSDVFNVDIVHNLMSIDTTSSITTTTLVLSLLASTGTSLVIADDFNVFDFIKNIGIGIVSLSIISFSLVYIFATFIIPQAANELEKQIKELNPELWYQYERKLQPGETLAQRPDLIQELGTELRRIQLNEFNKQQQQAEKQQDDSTTTIINNDGQVLTTTASATSTSSTAASTATIVDVEVIKSDDAKNA